MSDEKMEIKKEGLNKDVETGACLSSWMDDR